MLVLGVLLTGLVIWLLTPEKPPVLQAFINANVITIDAKNSIAEAVLIERDTIIAVGSTKDITGQIRDHKDRSGVVVHDLAGKTLLPGLIDAHSHFPASGIYEYAADLNAPPIGAVTNMAQLQKRLRDHEKSHSSANWIVGFGYDDTKLEEGRHPLRRELDAISNQKPIFILHISGHMGVANSAALAALNIDESSVAPAGGEYVLSANGRLNGLVLESATHPFIKAATDFSPWELLNVVQRAASEYAEKGVTSVQNGAANARDANGLKWASKLNVIPQRVKVWPLHGEFSSAELQDLSAVESKRFSMGAVKLIVDGSIQGYTAYLTEPYFKPPQRGAKDGDDVGYKGMPLIDREHLTELVTAYFKRNKQLAIHGNGDGAIDDILFAIEHAQAVDPNPDARTILVHAQMARRDQLRKMLELGVTPSFFNAHTYYWGDRHRQIFMGPDRAANMSPARTAQRIGLPFSLHLDSPVVPMSPMRMLWSATERKTSSGRVIGRRERISRQQALRAITIDAAYQGFQDEYLGSIEVGKLADLIVLDGDPLNADQNLLEISVESTLVGGVEIYRAPTSHPN